jgi:hypothetical protein
MGATGYIDPSVVTYVNEETGDVTLDAAEVGADPEGAAAAALVAANSYTDDEIGALASATDTALAGKASTAHAATHSGAGSDPLAGLSISQIASLQAALDALVPKTTAVNTAAPLTGGGALAGDLNLGLTFGQASATAAEGRAPRFAFAPWPISGRYIYTGYGANATTAQTLNQERCIPLPVWQGFTVSSLQVEVTTADVNALWRIGLRAATATGLPGNLLVDYGTFSGAALGAIGPTGLSLAFSDRTQYFLSATLQNGGGGTAALRAANWHDPLVLPASLGVLNTVISAYVQNGVTGALPPVSTPGDGNLGPRFMMLVV